MSTTDNHLWMWWTGRQGSGDASQEAGAVRLVLGVSDHEFPGGSSWVVTRPIPRVTVGSWMTT